MAQKFVLNTPLARPGPKRRSFAPEFTAARELAALSVRHADLSKRESD